MVVSLTALLEYLHLQYLRIHFQSIPSVASMVANLLAETSVWYSKVLYLHKSIPTDNLIIIHVIHSQICIIRYA